LKAFSAEVITATVTFTNALNLTNAVAISNAVITVNSDVRKFTNSVTTPATQILISTNLGTNIAQQVQQFLAHAGLHPFAGPLMPSSDLATYVSLRGTNDQAMSVTLGPTTWGSVTYSTQTVGAASAIVRLPFPGDSSNRVWMANKLLSEIDALRTNPPIAIELVNTNNTTTNRVDGDWSWTQSSYTLSSGANSNVALGTNVFARLIGPAADFSIVGITNALGLRSGLTKLLLNASGQTMSISNESPLVPAITRIITPINPLVLSNNAVALLTYDALTNRWIALAPNGAPAPVEYNPNFGSILVTNASGRLLSKVDCSLTTNQLDIASGPQALVWTNMSTNVVIQCTNVWTADVTNRTIDMLFINDSATNQYVTLNCPTPGGVTFHWLACRTNGATSFTVTNGGAASFCLTFWRTNVAEGLFTSGQ
jgi:hypothetical protein